VKEKIVDPTNGIIKTWNQGVKFEEEGYLDLGQTVQRIALKDIAALPVEERKRILDQILPEKQNGY
jgi:hypothetical protein